MSTSNNLEKLLVVPVTSINAYLELSNSYTSINAFLDGNRNYLKKAREDLCKGDLIAAQRNLRSFLELVIGSMCREIMAQYREVEQFKNRWNWDERIKLHEQFLHCFGIKWSNDNEKIVFYWKAPEDWDFAEAEKTIDEIINWQFSEV